MGNLDSTPKCISQNSETCNQITRNIFSIVYKHPKHPKYPKYPKIPNPKVHKHGYNPSCKEHHSIRVLLNKPHLSKLS